MAVETTNTSSGPFTANGATTVFPFTFAAASVDEVKVINTVAGTNTTVSPTLYSVTLSDGGGSVTFLTAPVSGTIMLSSQPTLTQEVVLFNNGAFYPAVIEGALDRAAIRDQWLNKKLDDAVFGDFLLSDSTIVDALGYQPVSPAVLKSILGSRSANVLDIADWDGTGSHDNATGYQALINQAAAAGVPVEAPGFYSILGSTITLPYGHIFRGAQAGSGQDTDPTKASTFLLAHSGKGFIHPGNQGQPSISISDQSTRRNQPIVVPGNPWTANDHDYDYYFNGISDLRMQRILTQNATRGILINGGRNTIREWSGTCFKRGLRVEWSYDTIEVSDVHLWTFFSQAQEVFTYQQNNLRAFELLRMDNPFFRNIFSIVHQYGFYIGYFPGDGIYKPAGTTSKLKLMGADLDIGDYAYYVAPAAAGHTAKLVAVSAQARNTPLASALMTVEAPGCYITGDAALDASGGNALRLTATSSNSRVALLLTILSYNQTNGGFPAVEVVGGGGHVDVLPGSFIINGNGAPVSSGDVTVWVP